MLMNALSSCSPEDYPKYLARFLEIAEEHPDYFMLDDVIKELIRVVTPQVISQHLNRLPSDSRRLVEEKLPHSKQG